MFGKVLKFTVGMASAIVFDDEENNVDDTEHEDMWSVGGDLSSQCNHQDNEDKISIDEKTFNKIFK